MPSKKAYRQGVYFDEDKRWGCGVMVEWGGYRGLGRLIGDGRPPRKLVLTKSNKMVCSCSIMV